MYFPLLPKEKGFRVEVGYGKNWTILSQKFGFSPARGVILPEIILPVSKQKCYNCAGMQEQKV